MNFLVIIGILIALIQFISAVIFFRSGRQYIKSESAFKREKGRGYIANAGECAVIGAVIIALIIIFGR